MSLQGPTDRKTIRRPLVVLDFDDTLFPTTALRALCKARVAHEPGFTLLGGAKRLLGAWDALMLGVLAGIAGAAGPGAAYAIVSAGDPQWVGEALRQYMPDFWARAQALGASLRAGVRADDKAAAIAAEAAALCLLGREPDALVAVGDHDLDEVAAEHARWPGSDRLKARAFVRIAPCDVGGDALRAVEALAEDAGKVPKCVAEALEPAAAHVADPAAELSP